MTLLYRKYPNCFIDAFDISESMINFANNNLLEENIPSDKVNFFVLDVLNLKKEKYYDLFFSNASLHWVCDSNKSYSLIYKAVKNGESIAIHQGGYGSCKNLHEAI